MKRKLVKVIARAPTFAVSHHFGNIRVERSQVHNPELYVYILYSCLIVIILRTVWPFKRKLDVEISAVENENKSSDGYEKSEVRVVRNIFSGSYRFGEKN